MQSMYLFIISLIGGLMALFMVAGWNSYKNKKLPDTQILFRWFSAGLLSAGIGAYAWIYGADGNPEKIIESLGEMLEVNNVVKSLSGGGDSIVESIVNELKVGMPDF